MSNIEEVQEPSAAQLGHCVSCKYSNIRAEGRICANYIHFVDDLEDSTLPEASIQYEFPSGGDYLVGDNFGCVHWEVEDGTSS